MINTRLITKEDFTKVTKEVNRFGEKVTINPIDTIETVGLLKDYKKVKSKAAYIYFTGVEVEGDIGQGIYMRKDYDGYHDRGVKLNIKGAKYIRLYSGAVYPEWFNENFAKALKDAAAYTNIQLLPKVYQLKSRISLDIQELHIDMNGATIECLDNAFNFNLGVDSILEITKGTIVAPNNAFKLSNLGRAKYVDCRTMMRYPTGIAPDTNGILTDGSLVEINSVKKFTQPITVVNEVDNSDSLVTNSYIANAGIDGSIVRINKNSTMVAQKFKAPLLVDTKNPHGNMVISNKQSNLFIDYIATEVINKFKDRATLVVPGMFYIQYADINTGMFDERDNPWNLFPDTMWDEVIYNKDELLVNGIKQGWSLGISNNTSLEPLTMARVEGSIVELAEGIQDNNPVYPPDYDGELEPLLPMRSQPINIRSIEIGRDSAKWPAYSDNSYDKLSIIAKATKGTMDINPGDDSSIAAGTYPTLYGITKTNLKLGAGNTILPKSLPCKLWMCVDSLLNEKEIASFKVTPNPAKTRINESVAIQVETSLEYLEFEYSLVNLIGTGINENESIGRISNKTITLTKMATGKLVVEIFVMKNGYSQIITKEIPVETLPANVDIPQSRWDWSGVTWTNTYHYPVTFRIHMPIIRWSSRTQPKANDVPRSPQNYCMRSIYYTITNDNLGDTSQKVIKMEEGFTRCWDTELNKTTDMQIKDMVTSFVSVWWPSGSPPYGYTEVITNPPTRPISIRYVCGPGETIRIRLQVMDAKSNMMVDRPYSSLIPVPAKFGSTSNSANNIGTAKLLAGDPITLVFE